MGTTIDFKVGDKVTYQQGSVTREYHFTPAIVVEVDHAKKRIGIAVMDVEVATTESHREGDKIVSVTTYEIVWTPKRVAVTSVSHTSTFDIAVPSPRRTEVSIPAAWRT